EGDYDPHLRTGSARWLAVGGLPDALAIVSQQPQPANPRRALPEVEVRVEQAGGTAVLGIERLPVVPVRDPRLAAGEVLHGNIRRVAAVRERQRVRAVVVDLFEQRVDGHALPVRVGLPP